MTIPASDFVAVTPGVLSAGGAGLVLNGLMIDTSGRVPMGTVQNFPSEVEVGDYFGGASAQARKAGIYFDGYDNSLLKPGAFLVANWAQTAVSAYLRGGNISGLSIAALQAITGTLNAVMDGYTYPIASLDISAASSFSAAAGILQTALNASKPVQATGTGVIAGTTLTISGSPTGSWAVGQEVTGSGVTADTYITALGTGVGGAGTYTVSPSQSASSTAVTGVGRDVAVTYDSVSGGFIITSANTGTVSTAGFVTGTAAAALLLTLTTGAVLSQGAAAQTPAQFMDSVVAANQNWVTFFNESSPDVSGFANRLAFASWANSKGNRYGYICQDSDVSPTVQAPASGSLGYAIAQGEYSGTALIWEPSDLDQDAMISGFAASISTTATNGRITFAFKSQSGMVAGVTDQAAASNLLANGYNFYGAYATASEGWNQLFNGQVSGPFQWLDSFINQIWLNNALQQALATLLRSVNSIPYNQAGYTLINQACMDPINAALNFGAIRPGVTLSSAQAAEVNNAAGASVSNVLSTRGWYLQIKDATPQVRQARQSPPITLWYMDGQSVQQINLASILVQ